MVKAPFVLRDAGSNRSFLRLPNGRIFSEFLVHRGRLPSKFRNYPLCESDSSVPFSIDHMSEHSTTPREAIPGTSRCLSMLLRGMPVRSAYNDRRNSSLLVVSMEVPCL
jgi:hypothetical protein